MNAIFQLMARHVDHRFNPDPTGPTRWVIVGEKALLDWDTFNRHALLPSPEQPGKQVLVLWQAPPLLPLIDQLYADGWKRGGWWDQGAWDVYAYLREDEAEIRVRGTVGEHEAGDRDTMHAFYGDPPPRISRRKSLKAEYDQWQRKNHNDEW